MRSPSVATTLTVSVPPAANVLKPLYKLMLTQVLLGRVVQTDETRVPVLQPGLKQTKPGYVGDRDHPHTVYDYTPTKARDGPAAILKDYTGFLQADAANVFDGFYRPGVIVEVGCWAHARRHFHDARDSDAARSAEALTRIREFYRVEDDTRDLITRQQLAGDAADAVRLQLRQERTKVKLADFASWLEDQSPRVLPKSPVGQAIAYARRQWAALMRFTEHGFLNIDNNASDARCGPSPWVARTGSSREVMPAVAPRPCCTRSRKPANATATIPSPICARSRPPAQRHVGRPHAFPAAPLDRARLLNGTPRQAPASPVRPTDTALRTPPWVNEAKEPCYKP